MILLILLLQTALAQAPTKTEVQVNICESFKSVSEKIELSSWKAKAAEKSYFVDNAHLELYKSNLTFKAKVNEPTEQVEIILKHNQLLTSSDVTSTSANCEYDLHGSQKKLACKVANVISISEFNRFSQNSDFTALLSAEQLNWLHELQTALPQNLQMTTEFQDIDYSSKLKNSKVALGLSKNWRQQEFTEISTRTTQNDELQAQTELLDYLKSKKIRICDDQNSIMTRLKLESFFKQKP